MFVQAVKADFIKAEDILASCDDRRGIDFQLFSSLLNQMFLYYVLISEKMRKLLCTSSIYNRLATSCRYPLLFIFVLLLVLSRSV